LEGVSAPARNSSVPFALSRHPIFGLKNDFLKNNRFIRELWKKNDRRLIFGPVSKKNYLRKKDLKAQKAWGSYPHTPTPLCGSVSDGAAMLGMGRMRRALSGEMELRVKIIFGRNTPPGSPDTCYPGAKRKRLDLLPELQ
jgi:hypothetical protein